ncbi:MAG: 2Fe-2S iron-sulfur cluster-binding protein [Spirochaetia bacterium]|jgi:ferredoxin
MSSIRIHGRSEVFSCNLTTSILNVLMRNAFPIETVCGGRAVCGRDLIRIRSGAEFLSPRRERETRRLAELAREGEPSGPDMRLACQTYVRGDVEIEVIHLSHALPVA